MMNIANRQNFKRVTRHGLEVIGMTLALSAQTQALADPGDIDSAFGSSGRVTLDPAPLVSWATTANTVLEDRNSKLVVAGSTWRSSSSDDSSLVVARLMPSGVLDWSFGNGGFVTGTSSGDRAAAMIEQGDGKLVVAGSAASDLALWRYDVDGALDSSFGETGVSTFDNGGNERAVAVLEQADGKLVLAATMSRAGDSEMALLRFNPNGTIDLSFGIDGRASVELNDDGFEFATALTQQPDGKLLIMGYRVVQQRTVIVVARTTADGTPDLSFDGDGWLEISDPDNDLWGTAMAVQPDGAIVIAGTIGFDTGWRYFDPASGFVLRLEPEGRRDASFGRNGMAIKGTLSNEHFHAVALMSDGAILTAGESPIGDFEHENTGSDMTATRFLPDGRFDEDFGIGGTARVDFGTGKFAPDSTAFGLLAQPDAIVLVGTRGAKAPRELAVARLATTDGGFGGLLGLTSVEQRVVEGATAAFRVRRTGGATGAVSVMYETVSGTAQRDSDYVQLTGTLSWADGDTSDRMITVSLIDDAVFEPAEELELRLKEPAGGAQLAASRATISISDDDLPPRPATPPAVARPQVGGGGGIDLLSLLLLGVFLASSVTCSRRRSGGESRRRESLPARA